MEKPRAVAPPLPVEIIQSILQQLDVESYHAARSTCQGWRYAASAPCMLSRVLQQTPVLKPPKASSLTGAEWNRYFDQIARINLLSYRTNVRKTVSKQTFPSGYKTSNVQASSSNGHITVDLGGARLRVYDNHQAPWEFPVVPSLYPPGKSIYGNLIKKAKAPYIPINERYAKYCLAVSSRGDILAVALGKKIQIYSLRRGDDTIRATPVEYTLNQTDKVFRFAPRATFEDTDGVVKSLEFTDDDALLRVCIDRETTSYRPSRVRYLGNPDLALNGNPDRSYWQASLNHIYLDTVALALDLASHDARHRARHDNRRCFLRGLRLLPSSFHIHSQHRHLHNHHCYHTRRMSRTDMTIRYFIAALQTCLVDGYAIGSILNASYPAGKVQIHRVIPSRYYIPEPLAAGPYSQIPQSYNNDNNMTPTGSSLHYTVPRDQPFEFFNPPRPNPPTNTPPHPDTDPIPDATPKNLRLAIPRWTHTNLPSATFSSPLLATSPDNRLAVIYEPGGSHTRFNSRGGSLYVVDISSCTPAYQPYGGRHAAAAGSPTNSTAAWLKVGKKEGPQDIALAWPFLLDQLDVDADAVGIEMSTIPSHPRTSPPKEATRYAVWAISEEKGLKLQWELGANLS
ncbi:hypothetical protein BDW42DRAFT_182963 [Aspergillus taichungensis]|uniref:F-box domain-containing protein n=1 Tax=Aspergillus taichungensis TaxID=482145 RepID=A0A2J5I646_9EURO|nr:hypothetical protein BDW42DRAFT_182963 [Aspergillus taichungensis]